MYYLYSSIIVSIINTAAANNLDAYKYLEHIFCQLPNINFPSNDSALEEYLPWSDKMQLECKINTEETNLKEENDSEPA